MMMMTMMTMMFLKKMRIKVTKNWPWTFPLGLLTNQTLENFDESLVQVFTCQLIIQTIMKFGRFFLLLTGVLKWRGKGLKMAKLSL